jgi:hypothetical protein
VRLLSTDVSGSFVAFWLPSSGPIAICAERLKRPKEGMLPMANHLTPTELAREAGLERKEVIAKCMELGVPIFQGRIDKTLFLANLGQSTTTTQATSSVTA